MCVHSVLELQDQRGIVDSALFSSHGTARRSDAVGVRESHEPIKLLRHPIPLQHGDRVSSGIDCGAGDISSTVAGGIGSAVTRRRHDGAVDGCRQRDIRCDRIRCDVVARHVRERCENEVPFTALLH